MRKKKSGRIKDDKTCFQHLVKPEEKLEKNLKKLKKLLGVDSLPGNRKAQEIFLKFAHQKLQEKGGLEWLLQEKKRLLARLAETERFSDEYLDSIARKAIFNGYIQVLHLADILGAEEDYGDVLPILWKDFECNRNGRKIETDTPYKRTGAWNKLLRRLTGMGSIPPEGRSDRYWADPALGELPPVMRSYLNLYNRDPATGELKIKPIKDRCDIDFIKLEDLPEYFGQIQRDCKVNLSLPKRLFPPAPKAAESPSPSSSTKKKPHKVSLKHYEDFVRKMKVLSENEEHIRIQIPGRSAKPYSYTAFAFQRPTDIAWQTLLHILNSPGHSYNVGPAHKHFDGNRQRIRDYDRARRRLDQISDKFIGFVQKTFGLQVPKGFKFYEKRKNHKPGTLGFKFQIPDGSTPYDRITNEELLIKIEHCDRKRKVRPLNESEIDDLQDLLMEINKRGLMSEKEIKDKASGLFESYKDKDIEKYDPYENEEGRD